MESLAPPYQCVLEVKFALQRGCSLREALENYCAKYDDNYSVVVKKWHQLLSKGRDIELIKNQLQSPYRRFLLDIFAEGLKGKPILNHINIFETEIAQACEDEIEEKLKKMPMISMIPLFLFQLPAVLILLFSPILQNFIEVFS